LIAILGPTASGKSELAVNLALRLGGEIVNCDAVQMVRHLNIGTAKPTPEQKNLVPHHLFDIIDPDQSYSAGAYMSDARRICRAISGRGAVPIVVGGTGLYLRALLEGIFEGPKGSATVRSRLKRIGERKGTRYLHGLLGKKDPEAALKVQPNDLIRVIRALEVIVLTGRTISDLQEKRKPLRGFEVLKVGIRVPRERLYDRINRRVEAMYQKGLLEEVRSVIEMGYSPSSKGFEALGYRYAAAVLKQEMTLEQAIKLTQRDTRRYAKRQLTWFRREENVLWIAGPGEKQGAAAEVLMLLEGLGER